MEEQKRNVSINPIGCGFSLIALAIVFNFQRILDLIELLIRTLG